MKPNTWTIILVVLLLLWVLPAQVFGHHLSQGEGSAPDLVDNYAHGVNAGGDVEAGSDDVGNMGDGVGAAETGTDNMGPGEPTDDGVNGAPDDVPGEAPDPSGPPEV